jgi:nitrous oxidase accessory protein NosD
MSLDIEDFVARSEGLSIEDVPTDVRTRLNDALGDLTGGESGPAGSPANVPDFDLFVSAERGGPGGGPYETISGALDDAQPGDIIRVEDGEYGADTFGKQSGLQIGSQDAGTDPASAPLRDVTIVGQDRPTIDGWVQILDPGVTFEGFEVTGEVFGYGFAAFEPDVTVRDVTISGVTNGLFVPSASDVVVENCTVEDYSFYGAIISGRDSFGGATPTIRDTTLDGASGGGAVGIGVVKTAATLEGNEITGNEFEGESGAGIGVFGGASATIQENTIANNDDGIFVASGALGGSVTATSNDIVNNLVGVANENDTEVNATGNWWGSVDGPGKTGTQGSVDADPWSTKSGPDWNTKGAPGLSTASVEATNTDEKWRGPMPPSEPNRTE